MNENNENNEDIHFEAGSTPEAPNGNGNGLFQGGQQPAAGDRGTISRLHFRLRKGLSKRCPNHRGGLFGQSDLASRERNTRRRNSDALDAAREILYEKNMKVNVLYDVEDREVYRFITEELMAVEIDEMHVAGMYSNFIYEEFHPNDREDARMQAESFLRCFLHDPRN